MSIFDDFFGLLNKGVETVGGVFDQAANTAGSVFDRYLDAKERQSRLRERLNPRTVSTPTPDFTPVTNTNLPTAKPIDAKTLAMMAGIGLLGFVVLSKGNAK